MRWLMRPFLARDARASAPSQARCETDVEWRYKGLVIGVNYGFFKLFVTSLVLNWRLFEFLGIRQQMPVLALIADRSFFQRGVTPPTPPPPTRRPCSRHKLEHIWFIPFMVVQCNISDPGNKCKPWEKIIITMWKWSKTIQSKIGIRERLLLAVLLLL